MAVTADTIESYFKEYGWTYERMDDTHFVSGFDSEVTDSFPIYITLTPSWVYFAIIPFVNAPEDPECERKLYQHLLRQVLRRSGWRCDLDSRAAAREPGL